jgi:hypothetical protein
MLYWPVIEISGNNLRKNGVSGECLDSAPAGQHSRSTLLHFSTLSIQEVKFQVLHYVPYSQYLSSCGFSLFPGSKCSLKGTCFQSVEDTQRKDRVAAERTFTKNFQRHCQTWQCGYSGALSWRRFIFNKICLWYQSCYLIITPHMRTHKKLTAWILLVTMQLILKDLWDIAHTQKKILLIGTHVVTFISTHTRVVLYGLQVLLSYGCCSYPCNRPWRLKAHRVERGRGSNIIRQSAQRWRWGQPHAPTDLYIQEDSW